MPAVAALIHTMPTFFGCGGSACSRNWQHLLIRLPTAWGHFATVLILVFLAPQAAFCAPDAQENSQPAIVLTLKHWRQGNLVLHNLQLGLGKTAVELSAKKLTLAAQTVAADVHLRCTFTNHSQLTANECENLQLSANLGGSEPFKASGRATWQPQGGSAQLELTSGGSISFDKQADLPLELNLTDLNWAGLATWLPWPKQTPTGSATLDASIRYIDDNNTINAKLAFDAEELSDDSGEAAISQGVLQANLNLQLSDTSWPYTLTMQLHEGEYYYHPIYLNAASFGDLKLALNGHWQPQQQALFAKGTLQQGQHLFARADIHTHLSDQRLEVNKADVHIIADSLTALYQQFGQLTASGVGLEELELDGKLALELLWQNGLQRFALFVSELELDETRFNVHQAHARLFYDAKTEQPQPSVIGWQQASYLGLQADASQFIGYITPELIKLDQAALIPLSGGSLALNLLEVRHWQQQAAITLAGSLRDIQLGRISESLGWPALNGSISGDIPKVQLDGGSITINSPLKIQVFDGQITVNSLQAEHLLSALPRVVTDIEVDNISLAQLTNIFDVGHISGRLDGQIKNLQLEQWRPTQFDAWFKSRDDSDEPRIISQKAVGTIGSLSGGRPDLVLARTYLRFFENFRYQQLGFSCKLRQGVCLMDGIAPALNGYYLVTGRLLPQINIIGYQRRVDWNSLLERLLAQIK